MLKHILSLRSKTLSLLACCIFAIPHSTSKASTATEGDAALTPLPEAVTSFGAATSEGWLYVFGGHKGERHEYNADMVSGSFHRLKLAPGATWEKLPSAAPSQGLPLVAHGKYIYRIGGMAARNTPGAKQDLYSVALVQRFYPARGRWEDFAPLPEPRSSHDAAVIGNKLYVGGGWQLAGGTNKPVWPDHALVLDLDKPSAGWTRLAQPFRRRALALAAHGSQLFAIGGMDSDNQPTLAVEIYDTASGQWSKGPELPTGKHKGFSCSAIAHAGRVYANSFQGDLLRLATDVNSWETVARVQHPRLAHRLVTTDTKQLLVLGGEDGESKRPDLEWLTPAAPPRPLQRTADNTTEPSTTSAR